MFIHMYQMLTGLTQPHMVCTPTGALSEKLWGYW